MSRTAVMSRTKRVHQFCTLKTKTINSVRCKVGLSFLCEQQNCMDRYVALYCALMASNLRNQRTLLRAVSIINHNPNQYFVEKCHKNAFKH